MTNKEFSVIHDKMANRIVELEIENRNLRDGLDQIEQLRKKGYVVRLDNGLNGVWTAMVYKPVGIGGEACESGLTLFEAINRAAALLKGKP